MNWKAVVSAATLAFFLLLAGIALRDRRPRVSGPLTFQPAKETKPVDPLEPAKDKTSPTAAWDDSSGNSPQEQASGATSKQTQTLPLIPLELQDNQPNPAKYHGWSLIHEGLGIVVNAKGAVVLKGTDAKPLLNLQVSPDASKLLIHHGDGQDATYNADGTLIESLPSRSAVSASVIAWQWKDTTALIGVAEETPDVAPNTYPETDLRPKRTSLFLYRLGDKQQLTSLVLPLTPAGTIIRLEGVTASGALVLSAVAPENYLGGPAEKALGIFDLGRAN